MSKCESCIHSDVCDKQKVINHTISKSVCKHFKDKSLFVELPCKVGQAVWFVRNGKIIETKVDKIVLKNGGLYLLLSVNSFYETTCRSIGKTVFLTKEDVEAKLKELESKK